MDPEDLAPPPAPVAAARPRPAPGPHPRRPPRERRPRAPGGTRRRVLLVGGCVFGFLLLCGIVGLFVTPWQGDEPLGLDSSAEKLAQSRVQAWAFQARIDQAVRSADDNPGSISNLDADSSTIESVRTAVSVWGPPSQVSAAVGSLENEAAAADAMVQLMADIDRSGGLANSQLQIDQQSWTSDRTAALAVLGQVAPGIGEGTGG